jgi:hypothetical protein
MPNKTKSQQISQSEKKRYCIVRKNDAVQLMFEAYKQSSATTGAAQVPQKQTEMAVKVAMLKTTKKGRAI